MDNLFYAQGDCLLKKCGIHDIFTIEHKEIPKDAKLLSGNLLLKGQTNSHALYGGEFQLLDYEGTLFVDVKQTTTLDHVKDHNAQTPIHAEHHAQKIEPGQYFVSPLMEYDHLLKESRQVID